jgi:putative tryptophan/tyrosine transport system substrate-binding protein
LFVETRNALFQTVGLIRYRVPLVEAAYMERREFMALLGGALAAWPRTARAQEPGRIYRLGFLFPPARESPAVAAVFDELRLNGFAEGQNLVIVSSAFGYKNDQIASLAASLVAASPDVIMAGPELPLRALQQITRTIPLIGMSEDMVREGLVASLARPGGNTTGLSILSPELDGKRQEILIEAVPDMRKIAVLADSNVTEAAHLTDLQQMASSRGIEVLVRGIARRDEVMSAISDAKASGAQGINFLATPMFSINAADIIRHVTNLRLPSIYQWPEDADEGALLAYGPSFNELYRQRARIAIKVLRGAKPSDIPVEQPTRFNLVVNLETAKAIGSEVSPHLLLRADKIIE